MIWEYYAKVSVQQTQNSLILVKKTLLAVYRW